MHLLHVAVARVHVGYRRYASAVTCWETALVEVYALDDVGVEGGEETQGVVGLIQGCAVEQKQVLIAAAPVYVQP